MEVWLCSVELQGGVVMLQGGVVMVWNSSNMGEARCA
jgi:hypothetical protein